MPVPDHVLRLRSRVGHDLLLLPAVCGLVFRNDGRLLLGRRADTGRWALVGGIVEPGEGIADAVVREVLEETGVRAVPEQVTGIYTTPLVTYANGDQAQYVVTAFRCRAIHGEPHVADDESLEVAYFALDDLPDLTADHQLRVAQAVGGASVAQFAPPSTQ